MILNYYFVSEPTFRKCGINLRGHKKWKELEKYKYYNPILEKGWETFKRSSIAFSNLIMSQIII